MTSEQHIAKMPEKQIVRRAKPAPLWIFLKKAAGFVLVALLVWGVYLLYPILSGISLQSPETIAALFNFDSAPLSRFSADTLPEEDRTAHGEDYDASALLASLPSSESGATQSYLIPDEGAIPANVAPVASSSSSSDSVVSLPAVKPDGALPLTQLSIKSESKITNQPNVSFDADALLKAPLPFKIEKNSDKPQVLIIHTHTSESYLAADQDWYDPKATDRTVDAGKNVVSVGNELAEILESRGIKVYHDTTVHDEPNFSGSYTRTMADIKKLLEKYPSIKSVIDVHRDSMTAENGTKYKLVTEINGEKSAQVMLVMGSNAGGLSHPDWQENLKFGLKLKKQLDESYPTLARPILLSKNRYNEHLTKGSMILEVGTDGNTLSEAITAVKYVGQSIADVLLS